MGVLRPSKVWYPTLTRSSKNVLTEVVTHGMGMIIRGIGRCLDPWANLEDFVVKVEWPASRKRECCPVTAALCDLPPGVVHDDYRSQELSSSNREYKGSRNGAVAERRLGRDSGCACLAASRISGA